MANPEHLKILKKGVKAWNKWRKENPDIRPDLSAAILHDADLSEANLHGANLSGVNLCGAHLHKVNFERAHLVSAYLPLAMLSGANLIETNFYGANLMGADLSQAELQKANLKHTNLKDAKLSETDLSEANLEKADLMFADLHKAKLIQAKIFEAILHGANLRETNLSGAELSGANLFMAKLEIATFSEACLTAAILARATLEKANLTNADLRACSLIQSNLTEATLTGAKLYGTARDDWIIKNVECKYVYWDFDGEQRSPKDRDLERGEFEQLYSALPTIEYIFESGMSPIDPLIMDRAVQSIREKRPEFDIKINSINTHGLAPSIKFTVQHEEHKEPALGEVRKEYETKLKLVEQERDRYWQAIKSALDKPLEIKLIAAGRDATVAMDSATINIEQHIHNALELQRAIADEPEESKSFAKMAKKTALGIIGGAIKDIAKGQVKEAAKQIVELGKDLGPIIAKTAAYAFFSNI